MKVPQFVIQSPYDAWSIPNILGINCLKGLYLISMVNCDDGQLKYIEDYHANTSALLKAIANR